MSKRQRAAGLDALHQMRPATIIPASIATDEEPPRTQRLPETVLETLDAERVPPTVRSVPLGYDAARSVPLG
jgi:hypothetical protein